MRHLATASLIALAAAAVPLAAQESQPPGSFRLPTNPTPTPTDVQGPVDPDAPILTRPRGPTPTPTPRATIAPAPTPTPQPTARATPRPVPSPGGSTLPPRFTPPAASAAGESPAVSGEAAPFPTTLPDAGPLPAPATVPAPATSPAADDGLPGWLYALGALLAALAIGAALFVRRRRDPPSEEAAVIERPRVGKREAATPPPAVYDGPPLMIEAQVKQLARSMMFATLSYELKVTNRGATPLEDVSFGGDLVTAHARVPAEQQLADPAMPLTPVQSLTRLDPGESASFAGDFRLPVSEIRPIPHGKAVVYVPLMRVRAVAKGMEPIARTFIVGLQSPGAAGQRLQPFRLDEMPQTYRAVGQKALD